MADRLRVLLGGAGVLALASTLVLSPDGLVAGLVDAALSATGTDYALAAALGGAGVLAAAVTAFGGRGTALNQASMPEAERPVGAPPPGASFDDRIGGWRAWLPVVGRQQRREVRARLRDAAVAAVAADQGLTPAQAREVVDRGEWTDDDRVAAYLADEGGGGSGVTPLVAAVDGESGTERAARRAVDEIESVTTDRDADGGEDR
ncbi:MAG: hypothetical protein ABEJ40_00705 [Haloarculaceae archaeon]